MQPSDEEVLPYDEDESEEEGDLEKATASPDDSSIESEREKAETDGDNLRDWGSSKADYYNADIIETEADALEEEQEARRLQQKNLQNLTEADFGFDENQWIDEPSAGDEAGRATFTERLPELEIKEDASSEELNQLLKARYPEFEPLAKDFVDLQKEHERLSLAAKAAEVSLEATSSPMKNNKGDTLRDMLTRSTSIATSKLRALSAYLGTIGIYLALLTSTASLSNKLALSPIELRDHPIIQSLVRSRQVWKEVENIQVPDVDVAGRETQAYSLEGIVREALANGTSKPPTGDDGNAVKRKRRTKAERAAIKAHGLAEKERIMQIQKTEARLAELDVLMSEKRREAKPRPTQMVSTMDNDSDFGDEEALTAQEAADKAHRKKSLRFYTSQIAQKSNKRGAASRDAGGDADLPYKERLKDRQARLMQEAESRGRSQAGYNEQLDQGGSGDDAEETRLAKEVRGDDVGEDDYYDMVSSRMKQKKDERKSLAEAQARAAAEGGQVFIEEEIGPDGKRAITYKIAKNKGLAPRRKKDVRNPRVKKKIRWEQKMKTLLSIRQVYKGGEGKGGYGGELTGIKTNVLKGVKL